MSFTTGFKALFDPSNITSTAQALVTDIPLTERYCLATNYRRVPIIARQNSNRHNLTKGTSQV